MIYDCILRWLIINWMLIFTKQLGKQNQFENNIFFSYCHSVIMTKVSSLNHYCFMFFSCLLLFLFLFYSSQINAEFVFGHHPLHSRCTTSQAAVDVRKKRTDSQNTREHFGSHGEWVEWRVHSENNNTVLLVHTCC